MKRKLKKQFRVNVYDHDRNSTTFACEADSADDVLQTFYEAKQSWVIKDSRYKCLIWLDKKAITGVFIFEMEAIHAS